MLNRYRALPAAVAMLAALAGAAVAAPAWASAVAPLTVTFAATEDVFISQAEPAKSFATATWVSVCGAACGSAAAGQRVGLTRFKVTGIPEDAEDVKVTLDVVSARTTDTTVSVRPVTGSWTEAATTWNTRPEFGAAAVASHTGFTAGTTAKLDVSAAVKGDGTYAFALTGTDATATVLMSSRETGNRGPKLTITYTEGGGQQTAGPLPFVLPGTETLRGSAKKVFAHYFTPYPVSLDNQAPASDYYARNYLKPDGESGKHAAYGGLLRDRPIGRDPISGDYAVADFKTEVKQAVAAGLDGFTVDILSITSAHWTRVQNLIKAAEAVDPGFKIVLMPDTNGLASVDSAAFATAMAKLAASKSVYRLADDRLVVAPFKAEGRTAAWWAAWMKTMETEHGIKVALGGNIDRAHGMGKIWMQPVSVQDERPNQGVFDEAGNTENLRATWKGAIDGKADWVQLTTWNDYSENTQFAPSRNAGWTYLDINAYYLTCYKLGCPKITNDSAYLTHRVQPVAAKPSFAQTKLMALRGGSTAARDTVEVLTMLTAPGKVLVTVGGTTQSYDAPAGVSAKTFPLKAGAASATVTRGSATAAKVVSPYPVTATPYVQDLHYRAASSER
ncbi:endo-1,3-alpha-glucanase family glycosylhydrolase [Nonomuraea sp. NPDC052265]|uniref:endo-1,3-alpha-glucanase family glycosylhydrolase n=1 Tax=Nonomuraea sp. NPDC052265 TaxID=3364374 RepID=UPI0037C67ED3